jgi:hypothetical protein
MHFSRPSLSESVRTFLPPVLNDSVSQRDLREVVSIVDREFDAVRMRLNDVERRLPTKMFGFGGISDSSASRYVRPESRLLGYFAGYAAGLLVGALLTSIIVTTFR